MGCKPRHYPRRASCALFLDDNYVHQANCFSHNDIYQANSASSDSSLSLSMIDEEIVDDDFCEWIVRELVKKCSYRYLYGLARTDKLDS